MKIENLNRACVICEHLAALKEQLKDLKSNKYSVRITLTSNDMDAIRTDIYVDDDLRADLVQCLKNRINKFEDEVRSL